MLLSLRFFPGLCRTPLGLLGTSRSLLLPGARVSAARFGGAFPDQIFHNLVLDDDVAVILSTPCAADDRHGEQRHEQK